MRVSLHIHIRSLMSDLASKLECEILLKKNIYPQEFWEQGYKLHACDPRLTDEDRRP